jgi:hypothetical protein
MRLLNKTVLVGLLMPVYLSGCGGGAAALSEIIDEWNELQDRVDALEPGTGPDGRVIDGYINGAKICVDINGNFQCDSYPESDPRHEPTTFSSGFGDYLIRDPQKRNLSGYMVVVEVPVGARDLEEGLIENAFTLAAPYVPDLEVGKPTNVTPLTTLVSLEVANNNDTSKTFEQKLTEGKAAVTQLTGFDSVLGVDHIADPTKADMAEVARVLTVALASMQSTLVTEGLKDVDLATDAERISSLKQESLNQAVTHIKERVIPSVVADGKIVGEIDQVINETKVSARNIALEKVQQIITGTKLGQPDAVDIKTALESGDFVIVQVSDHDVVHANGECGQSFDDRIEFQSVRKSDKTDDYSNSTLVWIPPTLGSDKTSLLTPETWAEGCIDGPEDALLVGGEWDVRVSIDSSIDAGESLSDLLSFDKNCVSVTAAISSNGLETISEKYCLVQRKVEGQSVASVFGFSSELWDCDYSGKCGATGNPKEVLFKDGALAYELQNSVDKDFYELDCCRPRTTSTLQEFLDRVSVSNLQVSDIYRDTIRVYEKSMAKLEPLKADEVPTPQIFTNKTILTRGRVHWMDSTGLTTPFTFSKCSASDFSCSSQYFVIEEQGREILVFFLSPSVRKLDDEWYDQAGFFTYVTQADLDSTLRVWKDKKGSLPGVYGGDVRFASRPISQTLTTPGNTRIGNKAFLESYLESMGIPIPLCASTSSGTAVSINSLPVALNNDGSYEYCPDRCSSASSGSASGSSSAPSVSAEVTVLTSATGNNYYCKAGGSSEPTTCGGVGCVSGQ